MNRVSKRFRILLHASVVLGLCATSFFAFELLYLHPYWTYRAFHVRSNSMCPTICEDERVFVQTQPETPYVPQRGDVISMEFGAGRNLFVKRVIGVEGDIVAPGPKNTVLVNGQVWHAPPVCGQPSIPPEPSVNEENPPGFNAIQIPKGSYFVIGDNLRHSLDSRYKEFGLVPLDRVRGKAAMIYWSPGKSRIGSTVR